MATKDGVDTATYSLRRRLLLALTLATGLLWLAVAVSSPGVTGAVTFTVTGALPGARLARVQVTTPPTSPQPQPAPVAET